tara:strand:+ start:180 stop:518 length:339 start_codon:yes stop_codon:yes gene_type:complete
MAVLSNLSVDQGSDFSAEVVVEDSTGNVANLTGFTGAGQIRKTYSSSTATNFVVVVTNAAGGLLTLSLANAVTNAMKSGRYVYDVEITETSSGEKTRVVEGQLTINPGVTQI